MSAETISIIAVLVAGLSALYARWAVKEAKKANELNRFKALLDLKSGYLAEMDNQMRAAKDWGKADTKHREVCKELDAYHSRLVKNEI